MKVLLKHTAYIENISYSRPFYIMDTISVSKLEVEHWELGGIVLGSIPTKVENLL